MKNKLHTKKYWGKYGYPDPKILAKKVISGEVSVNFVMNWWLGKYTDSLKDYER